jgi:predicted kinase
MVDQARSRPSVVVFTGLPGTGKSTLAELVASRIGAPAFAGDWLLGALAPHGILDDLDRGALLSLYYDLLGMLVTRQLLLGQSAVVDCLLDDAVAARWREIAARFDASLVIVECVCSDTDLHRQRVEGRERGIPGWHEVDWQHVQRMRVEFSPLSVERLTVDAVDALEDNARSVLDHLGS